MNPNKLLAAGIAGVIVFIAVLMFAFPAYNRYQSRANARNETITSEKQVKIAKNLARARYQTAIGLKKSQDEIRKTLTPLYVQFEMVQALQGIATDGKNNTVVYIPTDPRTGLPVVPINNTTNPDSNK